MKKHFFFFILAFLLNTFTLLTVSAADLANEPTHFSRNYTIVDDSCDVITWKNGRVVRAKIIEMSSREIRFKMCNYQKGPVVVENLVDIASIKYGNGVIDDFTNKTITNSTNVADSRYASQALDNTPITLGVLAILACVLGLFVAGIPLGIAAIVLGAIGASKADKNPNKEGRTVSIVGLIFGVIITLLTLVALSKR
ncbi:MAG: hypothetical protein RI894_1027 [Bacteroidota bacterium]|jgi:uncharacterized membrane protein YjgN (DUF898 family)